MSTEQQKVLESFNFLKQLEESCLGNSFIFRGTNKKYSTKDDGVNSLLYRWGEKTSKSKEKNTAKIKLFNKYYKPSDMEEDVVKKAKHVFADGTSDRTILTVLRHLGGRTNLIDFSRSLYIALFFACAGEFEKMVN